MFNRKQKTPFGKIAVGFGLGAVTGAAFALLYTPLTGKKMQKKLASVTEDVLEKIEDGAEKVQASVRKIARA